MDLLEKSKAAYRRELEDQREKIEAAKKTLAQLVKNALPEDVRPYVAVTERIGGGFRYTVEVPECNPVEVVLTRSKPHVLAEIHLLTRDYMRVYACEDIYSAIGRAHEMFTEV